MLPSRRGVEERAGNHGGLSIYLLLSEMDECKCGELMLFLMPNSEQPVQHLSDDFKGASRKRGYFLLSAAPEELLSLLKFLNCFGLCSLCGLPLFSYLLLPVLV